MRRLAVATAALLLLAVAGLGGWSALATQTSASADAWHRRGASADAAFVIADECAWVETWVSAASWVDQTPPGKPVEGSSLMVSIDLWWTCPDIGPIIVTMPDLSTWGERTHPADANTWSQADRPEGAKLIASLSGWSDAADVQISERRPSARGAVTVCDAYFPEACLEVDVSVDWDVAGGVGVSGWQDHDPVCNSHDQSGWREAAATGTLTFVVDPFNFNLIPDPAVYAGVGVWRSGAVCKA